MIETIFFIKILNFYLIILIINNLSINFLQLPL